MAKEPRAEDVRGSTDEPDLHLDDPDVQAWFKENLPKLRRSATGPGILYRTLAIGFVLGLAAHIGGYVLKGSASDAPALVGDLVYALGYALWTGVVVVLFVQVIPEVKKRQFRQAVAAYEATLGDRGRARSAEDPTTQPDRDGSTSG